MDVLPVPDGADTTRNNPFLCSPPADLFNILNLLSELRQFALYLDNLPGNFTVAALGSDRIDFTIHLLDQEIHFSPMVS